MTLRHPRLAHAIMALRPGAKPLIDFFVEDVGDGQGPRLVEGSMQNPPTQAEVDALTTAQLDEAQLDKSINVERVVGAVLLNHENRIRALESRPAITAAQFLAAIKTLLSQ